MTAGHPARSERRIAVLDTSVFITRETGRPIDLGKIPESTAVTVVTIAELQAGVLAAADTVIRARRLATLELAGQADPLPVDGDAALRWAELRVRLAEAGRRAKVNDLWIASIALANGMDVVTQDDDFDPIEEVGGPRIIRV